MYALLRVVLWSLFFVILAVVAPVSSAAEADVGVVFLHGKEGLPRAKINQALLDRLQHAGFRVIAPEMPWSRNRIYDTDVDGSMQEIAGSVEALRAQGAKHVVLIGHSMGANAVIRYAATRPVDGLIVLAPGHSPEFLARQLANDIAKARDMVSQGRSGEKARFRDVNVGRDFSVDTTASIYLSWMDPAGSAVMPLNAARIATPVPVLCVVGSKDPVTRAQDYIFGKFPAHPASRFVTLEVDHKDVPEAATDLVVDWLSSISASVRTSR